MMKELQGFGDNAVATMASNVADNETLGIAGVYKVECHDVNGNLKWTEEFPNLVNSIGKELMLNTLLKGVAYTVTGPFLGLISGAGSTFAAVDTMVSHAGWTEFIAYTVGGSAVRGTAVFGSASSTGLTPANITSSLATAITYTITGAGGVVGGCFLVTGAGAVSTLNSTAGTLYSAGNFAVAKTTTVGDTVSVTYTTTATS